MHMNEQYQLYGWQHRNILHWAVRAKSIFAVTNFKSTFQGRKGNPNLNFLVRIFSGGVGVFHLKDWGPKSSVCPSKPRKTKLFGGISWDFARISRGCPKSLRKKRFVFISSPLSLGEHDRKFATKNPLHFFTPRVSTFHHLELLGPLSCNK